MKFPKRIGAMFNLVFYANSTNRWFGYQKQAKGHMFWIAPIMVFVRN